VAIGAAASLPPGVYIAMSGRILDPDRARKDVERNLFEEVV
jgi:L-asparaginase